MVVNKQAEVVPERIESAEVIQARNTLLTHMRAKPRAGHLDENTVYEMYAPVFRSSRIPEYVSAIIAADEHAVRIEVDDIELFVERLEIEEVIRRFERLEEWMREDNPNTHDGVDFTPVLAEFLSRPSHFEDLINEVDRLKVETHNGRFRFDNKVQRDLEFRRFHHEYAKIAPTSRSLPYHGQSFAELYQVFSQLEKLPSVEQTPQTIATEHAVQAKRIAYEAAGFLKFLLKFRSKSDRHIVVLGNNRYGRQWVVEPLEDYFTDGFTLRYDRVPSHLSMRLTVPHARQRERSFDEVGGWTPDAMPREFSRELAKTMPHVVIVDGMSPKPDSRMMLLSRATKIYANWFVAFNDVRAEGDRSKFEHESPLPADHITELMQWYEFIAARKQLVEWVGPGPTYKLSLWTPEPTEYAKLGEVTVPCKHPDLDSDQPQVILANPIIYRTEGDDLPEILRCTRPYYFDGPERYVSEKMVMGFGPYGFSPRFVGPTTSSFVIAIQKLIKEEVGRLL